MSACDRVMVCCRAVVVLALLVAASTLRQAEPLQAQAAFDPARASLLITNAHVVDVVQGVVLRDRLIAVTDGRISAVVPMRDAGPLPASPRRLDAGGRYVIPGLWDMHVHLRGARLAEENRALLPLYIAHGITAVRDAGGDLASDVIDWRSRVANGSLLGPRIFTAGPKLDGPGGGWDGSIRLTSPGQVAGAFDTLQSLGVDYVKIYDGSTPRDVYLEILAEARRRRMIVTGHMPFSVRFREAVDGGLTATEHLFYAFKGTAANEDAVTEDVIARARTDKPLGLREALQRLTPAVDQARAAELYQRMARQGTAVVPTLHISQVLTRFDSVDHAVDPELRFIAPALRETYKGRVAAFMALSPAVRDERRAQNRQYTAMVRAMHDAGVTILAGSDNGAFNSHVYPGTSLHAELEALVAAGLSPAAVLRMATTGAASFMRRGSELGKVEPGHRGDLVILDANPLERITHTRGIAWVVLDGSRVLGAKDLADLLDRAAARWQPPGGR